MGEPNLGRTESTSVRVATQDCLWLQSKYNHARDRFQASPLSESGCALHFKSGQMLFSQTDDGFRSGAFYRILFGI